MSTITEPLIPSLPALATALGRVAALRKAQSTAMPGTSTDGQDPAPATETNRLTQSYAHAAEFSVYR